MEHLIGYFILAGIFSVVSGWLWSNFIHERIFQPLGMNDTLLTTRTVRNRVVATGYRWHEEHWRPVKNAVALRPSGAFASNVIDLTKWDGSLYDNRILLDATRSQMWSPVTLNSGRKYPHGFG